MRDIISKKRTNQKQWCPKHQYPFLQHYEKDIYKAACPAELECAFISDDKIIVLGRKDAADATVAMFQLESSDNGKTWAKKYTNIFDAYGSSPSVIFDRETGKICLYYFARAASAAQPSTNAVLTASQLPPLEV